MSQSLSAPSRRSFLKTAALATGGVLAPTALLGPSTSSARGLAGAPLAASQYVPEVGHLTRALPQPGAPRGVRPDLFRKAMAALQQHGRSVTWHDRMAIADFSMPSAQPRFHLVDLVGGRTTTLLVAHGSGSDPAHTGVLRRFSNEFGSNASCEGAFVTADYYVGKHGRSQRLRGLDPTNNNALDRAIVVHGAWYSNPDMIRTHGKLGRSQGCFAVGEQDLAQLFARLGEGRMIYSAKV